MSLGSCTLYRAIYLRHRTVENHAEILDRPIIARRAARSAWAEKAFYGTCDKYLSKNPDGSLQLDGICLVAGLGGKDHRDGSLAYYFSEPVVCNDAKGVGPLVLAYTEMIARK